jgi:hypothetical protein
MRRGSVICHEPLPFVVCQEKLPPEACWSCRQGRAKGQASGRLAKMNLTNCTFN